MSEKGGNKMNKIVDIGVNLTHKQFDPDREEVVKKAIEKGVTALIITGTSVRESKKAASYAKTMPGRLYSTAGVHPHDAKTCRENTIEELRTLAMFPQVVAIGECGLDYDRDFSPREVQRKWFEEQIKLAEELNMPLFLHERAAHRDFKAILKEHKDICKKAVVHCFTGTGGEMQAYLELGCSIGITGWICDERRGEHLRTLVKRIPLKHLMIETDAPFLLPRNMPDKPNNRRNEPVFLTHIVEDIAKCLGKTTEEIKNITYQNTLEFFGIEECC